MGSKYTKSARFQECQVRIPGHCNFRPETTVLAHLNGAGMGLKHYDIHGAYSCSGCHDVIDGRVKTEHDPAYIRIWHLDGIIRTQRIMIENGVLKL